MLHLSAGAANQLSALLDPGEEVLLEAEALGRVLPKRQQAVGPVILTPTRILWQPRDPGRVTSALTDRVNERQVINIRDLTGIALREDWFHTVIRLWTADAAYEWQVGRRPELKDNRATTRDWYAALIANGIPEQVGDNAKLEGPLAGSLGVTLLFVMGLSAVGLNIAFALSANPLPIWLLVNGGLAVAVIGIIDSLRRR
jgi:hypothetical protein